MSACSRCGSLWPHPGCHVCTEINEEIRDKALEHALEARDEMARYGGWGDDDVGPDMDDFLQTETHTHTP
jgi:hypothetical protein